MILLVACTDNELQRAEREQFGRKDADQEPAGLQVTITQNWKWK